jgi:organic hydroperoxide reductase OsmC/OhrA
MKRSHGKTLDFAAHLVWEGNRGVGTCDYTSYGREYRIRMSGKPDLLGSSAAEFHGSATRHDPEDLLVAALSSCHMLAYLALCARRGIVTLAYEDHASGRLLLDAKGGGRFSDVTLRPRVSIANPGHLEIARELHNEAHERCFIASSCNMPVRHEATVHIAAGTLSETVI